ncbi:hypothetical protein [Hyphococcus sp.]|uniref:hypothetical protein n=1 Tax=Hyphococcus sp. TaxID=2038636 RepID=UPI003753976E
MDRNTQYNTKGFVLLKELLPREITGAYLAIMQKAIGDAPEKQQRFRMNALAVSQPSLELFSNHFPFSLALLWGLTPTMQEITGEQLLPAYAYGRVYGRGAQLNVHNDRPSNEHSLSLTLGYSDDAVWDLWIDSKRLEDGETDAATPEWTFNEQDYVCLKMNPGDAVAYQGVHHRHARAAPNPNRWSAHLFMGWVNKNGKHKDHAFDGLALPPPPNFFLD